jgi:hypothetical protein
MPGTGKACMSCNAKKVRCSSLGAKPSAKISIPSGEEEATPRPKKAKTSGILPKAGKVSVEIGKSADGSAEILDVIRQQNALLNELLIFQEQTALATSLQAQWARLMTNYLGRIAHTLEARNEAEGLGSGASGSGSGKKKGQGKEKEQEGNAKNRSGNGDGDRDGNEDEDGDGDSEQDVDWDETMGKSM